jgi:Flp pilus assembly secretin CpaC
VSVISKALRCRPQLYAGGGGAGRISLQISSEVSELSNTGSVHIDRASTAQGLTIPALTVRRTATTVELPLRRQLRGGRPDAAQYQQVIDGFPGVKDLPVLGALFRSRDFADDTTELVVLVSAYLVEPTTEAALSAPTTVLWRRPRSGNHSAGPLERGLQEKTKARLTAGLRACRLCRALGGCHET